MWSLVIFPNLTKHLTSSLQWTAAASNFLCNGISRQTRSSWCQGHSELLSSSVTEWENHLYNGLYCVHLMKILLLQHAGILIWFWFTWVCGYDQGWSVSHSRQPMFIVSIWWRFTCYNRQACKQTSWFGLGIHMSLQIWSRVKHISFTAIYFYRVLMIKIYLLQQAGRHPNPAPVYTCICGYDQGWSISYSDQPTVGVASQAGIKYNQPFPSGTVDSILKGLRLVRRLARG